MKRVFGILLATLSALIFISACGGVDRDENGVILLDGAQFFADRYDQKAKDIHISSDYYTLKGFTPPPDSKWFDEMQSREEFVLEIILLDGRDIFEFSPVITSGTLKNGDRYTVFLEESKDVMIVHRAGGLGFNLFPREFVQWVQWLKFAYKKDYVINYGTSRGDASQTVNWLLADSASR